MNLTTALDLSDPLEPIEAPATIRLTAANEYRAEQYGVIYESLTEHDVTGPGVHNRHHPHRLEVWENRPDQRVNHKNFGQIVNPHGELTLERYSFLLSPQSVVISAHRIGDETPRGETLRLGQLVRLPGFGVFRIAARPLSNPHLERMSA